MNRAVFPPILFDNGRWAMPNTLEYLIYHSEENELKRNELPKQPEYIIYSEETSDVLQKVGGFGRQVAHHPLHHESE